MGGSARSEPVAVGLEPGFPLGFQGKLDQRLGGAITDGRDAERPLLTVGLGNPDPSCGQWLRRHLQRCHQAKTLGRHERLDAVDACCPLAGVVLGDPTHREALGRPGRHQESLESMDCSRVATLRGVIDALLQLERSPLDLLPGESAPFIPRRCHRAHDVCTATCTPTFRAPCLRQRIPRLSRGRWLLRQSSPRAPCG
jgi:hypothetical protein